MAGNGQAPTLDERTTVMNTEETARRLGRSPSTLESWRWQGKGPPYLKIGGRVVYRKSDLADWLDDQLRQSTSEGAGGS